MVEGGRQKEGPEWGNTLAPYYMTRHPKAMPLTLA
jgi:hypothetical protein